MILSRVKSILLAIGWCAAAVFWIFYKEERKAKLIAQKDVITGKWQARDAAVAVQEKKEDHDIATDEKALADALHAYDPTLKP